MGGGVSAHKEKIPRGNTPLIAAPNAPRDARRQRGRWIPKRFRGIGGNTAKGHTRPARCPCPAQGKEKYPHDTHPGLIPGIAVDEQRVRYGTDPLVFA